MSMKVGASDHLSFDGRKLIMPSGFTVSEATPDDGDVTMSNGGYISQTVVASGDTTGATDPVNLQAAINALKGKGGVVGFVGPMYLNAGITVYPGITLAGQGVLASQGTWSSSILTAVSALSGPVVTLATDPGNPTWTSFPNLANFAIQGTLSGSSNHGIYIADSALKDCFLQRVGIFNMGGNGIYMTGTAAKVWVTNAYIERCQGAAGIKVASGTMRISESYIYTQAGWAIDATSVSTFHVNDSHFGDNAGGSILVWSPSSAVKIVDNLFGDEGGASAPVLKIRDVSDSGGPYQAVISGNQFEDSRGGTATNHFIQLADLASVNAVITSNTFQGSSGDAIAVTARTGNHLIVKNNRGFNDSYGKVANPFSDTATKVGLGGTAAAPTASVAYTVGVTDQYLVASGGTGVSITVKDPQGNTVESGLTSLAKVIPVGYSVNFGAFSVAPTVASYIA
jgi:hypothetical protein